MAPLVDELAPAPSTLARVPDGTLLLSREGFVAHTAASAAIVLVSPWITMRLGSLVSRCAWEAPEALRSSEGVAATTGHLRPPVSLADPRGHDFRQALEEDDPKGKRTKRFGSAIKALMEG